jgi:hypothetical protein
MHFIKQSTAGFLLAMFTLASISHVPIARAADALPKQGSYSLTFPWHFKGQNHQVSETENFGIGLAWGPSLSDGKRGGFLDEAAVMSMYTVKLPRTEPRGMAGTSWLRTSKATRPLPPGRASMCRERNGRKAR